MKRERRHPRPLQPVVPRLHLLRLRGHHPAPHPDPDERAPGHRGGAGKTSRDASPGLEREVFEIRGESTVLERALCVGSVSSFPPSRWRWPGCRVIFRASRASSSPARELSQVQDIVAGRMLAAEQELTKEMKRLQAQRDREKEVQKLVGGIPVDSEYVVFIIDTSGSMQRFAWPLLLRKMSQYSRRLPEGEGPAGDERRGGLHVLGLRGQVDPRHPGAAARRSSSAWPPGPPSATRARWRASKRPSATLGAGTQKISLYVLGDEFTGPSIERVLDEVDRLNARGAKARPKRAHPRHRLPHPLRPERVAREHHHPLRDPHACPVRAERRDLRGLEQHELADQGRGQWSSSAALRSRRTR